ncbi:barstar family protein [Streptomyces minutiscleroticus]|uniref:barstar family protein n=1 Tax=Streptomyces minutiscleroticus TaxID=68238 RepID=UPI00332B22A6
MGWKTSPSPMVAPIDHRRRPARSGRSGIRARQQPQHVGAVRLAGQGRLARPHHPCLAGARVTTGPLRREYHLDGRFVTDVPGLHCAIAEALLGPGRYFGREQNAFEDCLCGGCRVRSAGAAFRWCGWRRRLTGRDPALRTA